MRAVGYARVSTEEQASTGCSLEAQVSKIGSFAALYDVELVEVVSDAGQSAKNLNRPGLQRVLRMLGDGTADGIVISKLDRLTRSVRDWATLIDQYFAKHASLLSVDDRIDTQTAAGRVVLNLLVAISQWEIECIQERTSTALKYKQKQGIHVGAPPFGYRVIEGHLVEDEAELRAVTLALQYRKQMMPYADIADEFIRLAIPSKRAGQWRPETIRQIVKRYQEGRNGRES